jgi:hypothetical protein
MTKYMVCHLDQGLFKHMKEKKKTVTPL